MFEVLNRFSNPVQAIVYFFSGLIIALYSLGLVGKGINFLVILFALYLMFVGFVKSGLYEKVMHSISRHKR